MNKLYLKDYVLAWPIIMILSVSSAKSLDLEAINEKALNNPILTKILSSQNGSGSSDSSSTIEALKELTLHHNSFTKFGTNSDNSESFIHWWLYSTTLSARQQLGDKEAEKELKEEIDRRRRRLEKIDCYTDGKPYETCLEGIWSQVATFDEAERRDLIKAYQSGGIFPKNDKLKKFWENYQQTIKL